MLPLLQIQMYYLDEIELLFLNQVSNKITVYFYLITTTSFNFSNNNFRSENQLP
jgi:hypothetical protein